MPPTKLLAGLVALIVLLAAPGAAGAAQNATATVTVLHGLPAFTADVYVNGELTLDGFEPLSATEPLELPVGDYRIEIRDVGASPDSEPALEGMATVEGGTNISIIAHLTPGGEPTLSVYENDLSAVPAGKGRVVVRHSADAPPLDVLIDGGPSLRSVTSGTPKATAVGAGPASVEVAVAGAADAVVGPVDFTLREGTAQILYPTGSLGDQTLDLMAQTLTGLQSAPGGVTSGSGGLLADPGGPGWAGTLFALGLIGILVSVLALVIPRRRAGR